MTLTEWIAARRAELEASTQGPWTHDAPYLHAIRARALQGDEIVSVHSNTEGNGDFIVSAHNSYGAMLDVIEAAEAVAYVFGTGAAEQVIHRNDLRGLTTALAALTETKS